MMEKITKNGIFFFSLFLFLSYLNPIHIHPFRVFYSDILSILGLLIFATSYLLINKSPVHIPRTIALPLFLIFLLLLQLNNKIFIVSDAFVSVSYFILIALALIIGASICASALTTKKFVDVVAISYSIAAAASVILQCLQIEGIDATPFAMFIQKNEQMMRPYANVGQPNQLALSYFFSFASIWWLYQRHRLMGVSSIFLTSIVIVGVAITQSRIGWVIAPIFLFCIFFQPGSSRKIHIGFFIFTPAFYVTIILILPVLAKLFSMSGGSIFDHIGGRSERIVLWRQAWHMAAEHPWFGVGWAGFGPEQVRIAADFGSSTYAEHSHNMILNFAAELGWPVTIVFFGYLTWWFYQTCTRPKQTAEIRFATMCLLAVFVHSMVEFPLWYAYVLIPVAVLMGMLDQMRWPSKGVQVHSSIVVSFLAIAVFCMAAVTWDYQRVVAGFKALRLQLEGQKFDPKMMAMPQYTFFPQFFEYFRLMQIKPREGMSEQDIAYFEHWSRRFGFVHILNAMAEIYVLNGEPKKASREMLTLQRLHPDLYPEYFDYWKARAAQDQRYRAIFLEMPKRDAP